MVEWVPTRESTQHITVKVSVHPVFSMWVDGLLFNLVCELPDGSGLWKVLGVL